MVLMRLGRTAGPACCSTRVTGKPNGWRGGIRGVPGQPLALAAFPSSLRNMRISVSSDMDEPVARSLVAALRDRGHEVRPHGALRPGDDPQWAVCSEAAAREVADGTADQAVVCCWTGTGASIAANKVPGARAALCTDAYTADGARRWNDANVLALSLRLTSEPLLKEILDAWFAGEPSADAEDRQNVDRVRLLDHGNTRR